MDLFELALHSKSVIPSVHALLIKPFKEIWENDFSIGKKDSIKLFTYVELLCSPKKSNPFSEYSEEERPSKVKLEVYEDENYPTTDTMLFATMKYKELLMDSSASYHLYVSALSTVHNLRNFLTNTDYTARTTTGAMRIKPKEVTSALKDLEDIERTLLLRKNNVERELKDSTKTRNDRVIGEFER